MMRNKEAKCELEALLSRVNDNGFAEAIGVAIDALERELCEDAISREAVLDLAILAPIAPLLIGDEVHYENVIFANTVADLPSVQQQTVDWEEMIKDIKLCFNSKIEDSTKIDAVDTSEEIVEIINKYRKGA